MNKEVRNRYLINLFNNVRLFGGSVKLNPELMWPEMGFHGDSETISGMIRDYLGDVGLMMHPKCVPRKKKRKWLLIYDKDAQLIDDNGEYIARYIDGLA